MSASALRLDSVARLDGWQKKGYRGLSRVVDGGFRVVLRQFASGVQEVTWGPAARAGDKACCNGQERRVWLGGRAWLMGEKSNEAARDAARVAELAAACQRRAKALVRRKVLTLGADHLVTLTYRECVTSRDQALADFRRFARGVRDALGGFAYVAVPELQKRGAIHWHIAVRGRQDVRLLRSIWWGIVGEGQGNIDVSGPKGWKKVGNEAYRVGLYIAKYVGKSMSEGSMERNGREKRYLCSQGIDVPAERFNVLLNPVLTLKDFAKLEEAEFGGLWVDGAHGCAVLFDMGEKEGG